MLRAFAQALKKCWIPATVRATVLVVLCAGTLSGCAEAPSDDRPPNIVLISLDTLRRDAVGLWNGRAETPNLDAIAEQAVVFDDAWAQIPFTLPSHMSVFTGLYPDVHGVDRKRSRLAEGVPTLPTLLQDAGYRTVGIVTNLWMKGEFGFDRGFDHYERLPYGLVYADRVNERAFELVDGRDEPGQPLFLFLHYIDPHSDFFKVGQNALPYYAPPEFLAPTGIGIDSREFCDDGGHCATEFLLEADRRQRTMDQQSIDRIAALYARGVTYLDTQVGALVSGLQERQLWNDALVVVMSDHGEEFREHGRFIHVQPYAESLAIPLLVKLPHGNYGGTRIDATVQTVDLLPTLLDAAGVAPPDHVQGIGLLGLVDGGSEHPPEAFGRDKLDRQRYALRSGPYTLVHHTGSGTSELYDRRADPGEREDIARNAPHATAQLEQRLLEILAGNEELSEIVKAVAAADTDILTDDEASKLRAIGYLD